jgi:carbonic anhydrase/acetyltransferase-like protein (isoleucine patch superfamily)
MCVPASASPNHALLRLTNPDEHSTEMLIRNRNLSPQIDQSSYIAPTAVVCGDVRIHADCRIMFGAVIVSEGAPIEIGQQSIVMDNAVIRSWPGRPVVIGNNVMVGPRANVNGAHVSDHVFIATGATVFPGATLGEHAVVRANAVVHVDSDLKERRAVPESWTAIGRPAEIVPPGHDERALFGLYGINFTEAVFGESRSETGLKNYVDLFASHFDDELRDALEGET